MLRPSLEKVALPDGYQAVVRWWRPSRPRGAVLYLHGIQSHGGWYEATGTALADAGFVVLMPDRRGSGLNQSQRGDAESAEQCLEDTTAFLNAILHESGFSHAHGVGVSWGGKLLAALAPDKSDKLASLSLVAPGIFPRIDLTMAEKFRVGISLMNDPTRRFDIPLNDPRLFTNNPDRIRYVNDDPDKLMNVTARFLLASRRLDRRAMRLPESDWCGAVHLMLAGHDPIIDNPRTKRWYHHLPPGNHRLTEYPEAFHTIEFEPDPRSFFNDLVNWIVSQSPPVAGSPRDTRMHGE